MNKYRKKPVVIEAIIFDGNNHDEIAFFCNKWSSSNDKGELTIRTLEGQHIASIGDYIIKGVKGEFYPCKPDIFELTYEKVESSRSVPLSELTYHDTMNRQK